ncbi:quinone-dependent dihydroorotate dehydrogenase [Nodosilinea sp. LEGE 07298]|uniref:quinone-dependent dihydroorotate dehydrogenase n=1 Tax=Nodosilinea sp. LEGE 07298 TaxID=2777970 RepID=UPI001882AB4A|nr:quinone-dependent dihydroorotate dehydrogenase [Nodosilinea sp. LEGE 07298]MBE9109330.1 quinone-dependent dihydroorotate dehydrogenase [Nodosilinea sp. LEGE 07298]
MKDPYRQLVRPLLFHGVTLDPEFLHHRTMNLLTWLGQPGQHPMAARARPWLRQQFCLSDPRLAQTCWGLTFANPLGLAAGFDKDGTAAPTWPLLGFGFAELGTVTCYAQPGNPQPRLFRLVQDEAVLNRMGFNNQGSAALADRLAAYWYSDRPSIPIGINLGKSKVTELADAADDYRVSFQRLYPYGDYFVVNVSSPNTPGLRSLQAADQLGPILAALQAENSAGKPLLVKIAPDLAWPDIDAVVELAQAYELAGIIATNTTIAKERLKTQTLLQTGNRVAEEAGGISGAPLRQRSTEVIHYIYQRTGGSLPIVGVGGIFTAADAWEKIVAGATLLQVYTGWVYEGPWMVRRVLKGLLAKLEEHQLPSISDAVGLSHRL